ARTAEEVGGKVGELAKDVRAVNARLDQVADQFGAIDRRLADREKQEAEQTAQLQQTARDMARQDDQRLKGQGKLDDVAKTLDQLNEKLAKANPARAPDPARPAEVPAAPPAAPERAVALTPGARDELLVRDT